MSGNKISKERVRELFKLDGIMDELFDSLSPETQAFIAYLDSNDQEMLDRVNSDLTLTIKARLSELGLPQKLNRSHANSLRIKALIEEAKTSTDPLIVNAARFAKKVRDKSFRSLSEKDLGVSASWSNFYMQNANVSPVIGVECNKAMKSLFEKGKGSGRAGNSKFDNDEPNLP